MRVHGVVLAVMMAAPAVGAGAEDQWRTRLQSAQSALAAGRDDEAAKGIRHALGEAERLGVRDAAVARGLVTLGGIEVVAGRYDDAEARFRQGLAMATSEGATDEQIWASLALADFLRILGDLDDAEVHATRALAAAESGGATPAAVARSWHVLGSLRAAAGQREEADWHYRRALQLDEQLFGAEDPALAQILADLGVLLLEQGRFVEGETILRRAVSVSDRAVGPTRSADARGRLAALNALGAVLESREDYNGAEVVYRRAVVLTAGSRSGPRKTAATLNNLASLLVQRGKFDEADTLVRRALGLLERSLGPHHPKLADGLNTLALVRVGQRRMGEAEGLLRRASRLAELGEGSGLVLAANLANRGALRLMSGRYSEAESFLEQALDRAEDVLGQEHPALVRIVQVLADSYRLRNRPLEAEASYERALHLSENGFGKRHSRALPSLAGLALLAEMRGHEERAEWFHHEALSLGEEVLDPLHPDRAVLMSNLAAFYQKHGDVRRAEPLYVSALALFDEASDRNDPRRAVVLQHLASLYATLGRSAEATRMERRLAALAPAPKVMWNDGPVFSASER